MADINVIVLPDGTEYPVSDFYLPAAISNPTDGQVLIYDAENDVWRNGTGGGGGASSIEDLDDVSITTPTDGQVLKYDATGEEWKNVTLQESDVSGLTDDLDTLGGGENIVDKVPYIFRISGGDINIGNRELDKIIGGTFAWNQLNKNNITPFTSNGVMYSSDGNGNVTANGTPSARTYCYTETSPDVDLYGIAGHVFLSNIVLKNGSIPEGVTFGGGFYEDSTWITQWTSTKRATVFKAPNNATRLTHTAIDITQAVVDSLHGGSVDFTVSTNFFDLTQMFGPTIADYIYSLEQATAGAGVAYFRKLFSKDYYAYNAGELMSVKTSAHKMVGFNRWEETTKNGYYSVSNGIYQGVTGQLCTQGYIAVKPNTTYYCYKGSNATIGECLFYDENKTYLGYITPANFNNHTFTTPNNCHYITFNLGNGYGTTYNKNICVNISSSKNGTYEPYSEHNYPLDANLELRGIPKLDSNNKLYYDGDTYSSDGAVTRKYGIVDLGTLDWTYDSTNAVFWVNLNGGITAISGGSTNIKASKIYTTYVGAFGNFKLLNYALQYANSNYSGAVGRVVIRNTDYTDATAFTNAMSGVYLVYELATPTSESASPYQNPQIVDDLGMEEYIDERSVPIPVGHETTYLRNLKEKLEDAPAIPVVNGDYVLRKTTGGAEYVEYYTKPAVNYSTDEHVVGTWIDGKTIYERTYTFTAPSSNTFTREDLGILMSSISNAWIDVQNSFAKTSGMCSNVAFYDGNSMKPDQFGGYLNFLQTNLAFDYRVGSDLYSSNIVLTIRYTKSS